EQSTRFGSEREAQKGERPDAQGNGCDGVRADPLRKVRGDRIERLLQAARLRAANVDAHAPRRRVLAPAAVVTTVAVAPASAGHVTPARAARREVTRPRGSRTPRTAPSRSTPHRPRDQ